MKTTYVALVRKEPETDYWVDVPDIPGCVSDGRTAEEAIANFDQALQLHLSGMAADGYELAKPRSLKEVVEAERDAYSHAYMIEIDDTLRRISQPFAKLAMPQP